MIRKTNDCVKAIQAVLASVGIKPVIEPSRGNHIRITWEANGKKRLYFAGLSPSDWRAPKKAASDVRRMLRQDGIEYPRAA